MASIERRGDSWRVYWRQGGRGGQKQSVTFAAEVRARRAMEVVDAHRRDITAEQVYAIVTGIKAITNATPAPLLPTVAEFADTWLASRTRITPGVRGRYRRQLDLAILPAIGHLRLDEVDGAAVATLLNDLGRTRTSTTVTRYYSVIHSLFGFAVVEKLIGDNPARRTDYVRDLIAYDDQGEQGHVYLEHQEFARLLAAADPQAQPLIACLAETGTRFSEATALRCEDLLVFRTPPAIRVVRAWKQDDKGRWYIGPTKGRERRTVPVAQRLIDRLLPLALDRPGDALLFTAPRGGRIVHSNWRTRYWLPAVAKAGRCEAHPPVGGAHPTPKEALAGPRCGDSGGVKAHGKSCRARVAPGWNRCGDHLAPPATATSDCDCPTRMTKQPTPHDLRHSHVSWLVAAGRPLIAISRRVGHHSITITERTYAAILPTVDEETASALDAMTALEVAQANPDLLADVPAL